MKYAALLLLTLTAGAHAASFDCSRAASRSEKMICQTPALSAADEQLAETYRKARTASGNSAEFHQLTRQNWQQREQCQTVFCMNDWYSRSQQLYRQIAAPQPNSQTAAPQPTHCLSEGSDVTLTGTLLRITFPGPPNFESVEQGDEPETYWVLQTDSPLCASDAPDWGDKSLLQLTVDASLYQTHRSLIGHRVRVSGRLLYAETGHHHTPVMIGVGKLGAE